MVSPGYQSLNYSPAQQGFDASTWRTAYGTPYVASGYLNLSSAEVIHYGQIFRGEASFIVNLPTGSDTGGPRAIGLYDMSTGSQAYFYWDGDDLKAVVRNAADPNTPAVNATTVASNNTIPWDSNWTGNDITMKVRWEAGYVKFFINGTQVAAAAEASSANWSSTYPAVNVPTQPLSIFLMNQGSDVLRIKSVVVTAIQQYSEPTLAEGAVFGQILVFRGENITVVENVTMRVNMLQSFVETVTITENVALTIS